MKTKVVQHVPRINKSIMNRNRGPGSQLLYDSRINREFIINLRIYNLKVVKVQNIYPEVVESRTIYGLQNKPIYFCWLLFSTACKLNYLDVGMVVTPRKTLLTNY